MKLTRSQRNALARIAASGVLGKVWLPDGFTDGIQWRTMQVLKDAGLIEHVGDSHYAATERGKSLARQQAKPASAPLPAEPAWSHRCFCHGGPVRNEDCPECYPPVPAEPRACPRCRGADAYAVGSAEPRAVEAAEQPTAEERVSARTHSALVNIGALPSSLNHIRAALIVHVKHCADLERRARAVVAAWRASDDWGDGAVRIAETVTQLADALGDEHAPAADSAAMRKWAAKNIDPEAGEEHE